MVTDDLESRGLSIIARLFPSSVLEQLFRVQRATPSKWDSEGIPVRERHSILNLAITPKTRPLRAYRRAWASYLARSESAGLLAADFIARITSTDDNLFRGGMAECLTIFRRLEEAFGGHQPGLETVNAFKRAAGSGSFDLVAHRLVALLANETVKNEVVFEASERTTHHVLSVEHQRRIATAAVNTGIHDTSYTVDVAGTANSNS